MEYRGYNITPLHLPGPDVQYQFLHEDFDGEEYGDYRYGFGMTIEDCKSLIDDMENCLRCGGEGTLTYAEGFISPTKGYGSVDRTEVCPECDGTGERK